MYDAGKALILKLKMREKKRRNIYFFFSCMYLLTYEESKRK